MLCSLCNKSKIKIIQLPCHHNICLSCIPKHNPSTENLVYECKICLHAHKLLISQQKLDNKRTKQQISILQSNIKHQYEHASTNSLFCWTCTQLITLNEFLKGRHQGHNVQTYIQSLPNIKTRMIQQLQKSLTIIQYLKQHKSILQQNTLSQQYNKIIQHINTYIDTQHKIIQIKKQQLLMELENNYNKSIQYLNKQLNIIQPSLEDAEDISDKIERFLMDELHLEQLDPLKQISCILDQFTKSIKHKQFNLPSVPIFVEKYNLSSSINQSCSLYLNINKFNQQHQQSNQNYQNSLLKKQRKLSSNHSLSFNNVQIKQLSQVSINSSKFYKQNYNKFSHIDMNTMNNMNSINHENKKNNQNHVKTQQDQNKKVKLVQRIKGKMKLNSIFTQNTYY